MKENNAIYKELKVLIENKENMKKIMIILSEYKKNDKNNFIELVNKCINLCEKKDFTEHIGCFYYCLGCFYLDCNKKLYALKCFVEALDIFKNYDNYEYIAYSYEKLSTIFSKLNQLKLSNEILIKGITNALKGNNNEALYNLLIKFTINLAIDEQYKNAEELLNYTIQEYKSSTNNIKNKVSIKKITAYIEANNGEIVKALKYVRDIIFNKPLEDNNSTLSNISDISIICYSCYVRAKNYEKAEKCLMYCYNHLLKNDEEYELLFIICKIIELSKIQNNYQKYYVYTSELFERAKKNNEHFYIKKAYNYFYKYYKINRDYEKAVYFLGKYNFYQSEELADYNELLLRLDITTEESNIALSQLVYSKTNMVLELGQKITSILDVDKIYILLCNELKNIVNYNYVVLSVYNKETNNINIRHLIDNKIENIVYKNDKDKKIMTFTCINKKQHILVNDFFSECKYYESKYNLEKLGITEPLSMIYVPIIYNKQAIGSLSIQSIRKNAYAMHDVNILKMIASYLSVAITNAKNYKELENKAVYDSLTGFFTKGEIIKIGSNLAVNNKLTNIPFCIFMIDLNDFSSINDTYGHVSGDEILSMLAKTIKKSVRKSDYIGRYGGDEILVLSPELTVQKGLLLAERIKNGVKNTKFHTIGQEEIQITISIGIYEYNDSNVRFIDAVDKADKMLYKDKSVYKYKSEIK